MNKSVLLFFVSLIFIACNSPEPKENFSDGSKEYSHPRNDWNKRRYTVKPTDKVIKGSTYLGVYSEIYARKESKTYPLTITVSIRNTSLKDSVFINKTEYYNTHGEIINTYFDKTIYVAPMETVEIVVEEGHEKGGTGGNFVFHWFTKKQNVKPLFDAVMISASGQQGISFTTQGVDLE